MPQVGTQPSGEIDYDELRQRLEANSARPAIINVNIGTTVRGAVDDLDRVLQILAVRCCRPHSTPCPGHGLRSASASLNVRTHCICNRERRQSGGCVLLLVNAA